MNTVVKTRQGDVRGSIAGGVHTFKGVPYAAPPFGANRLRPPQPVEPWSGVRDALTFGPTPPQLPNPPLDAMFANPAVAGEGCLKPQHLVARPLLGGTPGHGLDSRGRFRVGNGCRL